MIRISEHLNRRTPLTNEEIRERELNEQMRFVENTSRESLFAQVSFSQPEHKTLSKEEESEIIKEIREKENKHMAFIRELMGEEAFNEYLCTHHV